MNLDLITNIFFPRVCVACRRSILHGAVCGACFYAVRVRSTLSCPQCGARCPRGEIICHTRSPYVLGAAADYEDATAKALVHHLKFRSVKDAALPLARLISEHATRARLTLDGCTVMPIPLYPRRRRARGYNQSELIARVFAARHRLALDVNSLVRARNTKPQSETPSVHERKENLRGAFVASPSIRGADILLIDDVTTSGATFLEASLALKAAGAGKIVALAAAQA